MKLTSNDRRDGVPASFIQLSERLRSMDRRLGYFGQERFVFFYYEPRGEEVIWNDGRTYGFSSGGWGTFMHEIARLAKKHDVNVGITGAPNTHVLILDRQDEVAYFAEEWEAEGFFRHHRASAAA